MGFVSQLITEGHHIVHTYIHRWRRGTLRGRRGTWSHLPSFCVAGVALGHIHALMSLHGILAHCLFAALSSACAWQLIPSPHQRCNTVTCIRWMKRGTCICWTWLLRHLHRWSKILKILASCSFRLLPVALWVWSRAIWWQAKSCQFHANVGVWYPFEI